MKKILLGFIAIGLFTLVGCKHAIIDLDGNVYTSVSIGTQEWITENLRTTKYSDGTVIPNVIGSTDWGNLSTGGWSHYDNDISQYGISYGKLYNWYAVNTKKLCPTGWNVPSEVDWTVLTDYLAANGHDGEEAKALKAFSGWNDGSGKNGIGTDNYGWNGLPGGYLSVDGYFFSVDYSGHWWSSSQVYADNAWFHSLNSSYTTVGSSNGNKYAGSSVRCLRD